MNRARSAFACLLVIAATATSIAAAGDGTPRINVVYPKPGQTVTAVDSTFIFGHIFGYPDCREVYVDINGEKVEVHEEGGFLAFVPVTPGVFSFNLTACLAEDSTTLTESILDVIIPVPVHTLPFDSLQIAEDYNPPDSVKVFSTGDLLEVAFWGTPGCEAWFSIPGVVDSVPMAETPPKQQPYWGEAVFGVGAVPESVLVEGVYTGFYLVPPSVTAVDAPVVYHIAPTSKKRFARSVYPGSSDPLDAILLRYLQMPDSLTDSSSYRVSLNHPDFPFTVRFTDSVQIIRHGPRKGYFSIFQPEGVEALAIGAEGDWYRLRLSHSQYAWAHRSSVERLPKGLLPPKSYLSVVRTYNHPDHLLVEFPLKGKHPFRIYEDDARTLRVQLFGVTTDTDWIRYDFSDTLVDVATWSQPEDDMYELRLRLTSDLWGYDTHYTGNSFYLKLNRAPERPHTLWGKRVVIDPGHSHDAGAVGPTGYTEAEANLGIALVLQKELERKGAIVIMTRDDASHLPLYDRPMIAKNNDADLFVSVHNNALPDGVDPWTNHGTSSYYYHPHSIEL
ncbi:MAG: N-acetylmuramoyl-L-alanine amidase, partial [bacterium]|nr:N-acetylmuramoyl-L-alanine amidase [bacterium]